MIRFPDRAEAGRQLAPLLMHLRSERPIVVGLPRGGIPVAAEVARALGAPLDIVLVRKLGLPGQRELAMGAIGEGGARVLDEDLVRAAGVSARALEAVESAERAELERRARRFRAGRPPMPLAGRTVVVVDDGVATGATAGAACQVVRARGAGRVVLATPVAPTDWTRELEGAADEFVCLQTPNPFISVGRFYVDFDQTTDAQVTACLEGVAAERRATGEMWIEEAVDIAVNGARLRGDLRVPAGAIGVVIFAHGSGSSRHSLRNRSVADVLVRAGVGTLLFDLLTADEERDRANVFDVELLAERLLLVTRWLRGRVGVAGLPLGYFGASTGAAAAVWAATAADNEIAALVSRGGRVDLADVRVPRLCVPTMLIVGGEDLVVLDLNRNTQSLMQCVNELVVVPGATHLFEEPGTLAIAAAEAKRWFVDQFAEATQGSRATPAVI